MMVSDSNWRWAGAASGVFFLAATTALAGGFAPERVSKDSKWILHLDGEAFLKNKAGQYIADNTLEKEFASINQDLKKNFGTEIAWRHAQSVTVYGFEFKTNGEPNGIVLVEGEVGIAGALDKVWKKEQDHSASTAADLDVIDEGGSRTYIWKHEHFGAEVSKNLFALARSKAELERAKAVLAGKEPSLPKGFLAPEPEDKPIFQVFAPHGLEGARFSGPVALLSRCTSGHLCVSEKKDDLWLNLRLSAGNEDEASQIRQVVQGIVSIGLLANNNDPSMKKLARSTSVAGGTNEILVKTHLPAADVISHISKGQVEAKK